MLSMLFFFAFIIDLSSIFVCFNAVNCPWTRAPSDWVCVSLNHLKDLFCCHRALSFHWIVQLRSTGQSSKIQMLSFFNALLVNLQVSGTSRQSFNRRPPANPALFFFMVHLPWLCDFAAGAVVPEHGSPRSTPKTFYVPSDIEKPLCSPCQVRREVRAQQDTDWKRLDGISCFYKGTFVSSWFALFLAVMPFP